MNHDALNQAIDAFVIEDVYLRESRVKLAEKFEPKIGGQRIESQFRIFTKGSELVDLKDQESGVNLKLFRAIVDTGLRFVGTPIESPTEDREPSDPLVLAEVFALFVAEYRMTSDQIPSQEVREEFAKQNALYHVWPYWREYLQSTCARFLLPSAIVPMFRLAKKDLPPQKDKKSGRSKSSGNR